MTFWSQSSACSEIVGVAVILAIQPATSFTINDKVHH